MVNRSCRMTRNESPQRTEVGQRSKVAAHRHGNMSNACCLDAAHPAPAPKSPDVIASLPAAELVQQQVVQRKVDGSDIRHFDPAHRPVRSRRCGATARSSAATRAAHPRRAGLRRARATGARPRRVKVAPAARPLIEQDIKGKVLELSAEPRVGRDREAVLRRRRTSAGTSVLTACFRIRFVDIPRIL